VPSRQSDWIHGFETLPGSDVEELPIMGGHGKARLIGHSSDTSQRHPVTHVDRREQSGSSRAVLGAVPHADGLCIVHTAESVPEDDRIRTLPRHEPAMSPTPCPAGQRLAYRVGGQQRYYVTPVDP
jgi:hypothetical protein